MAALIGPTSKTAAVRKNANAWRGPGLGLALLCALFGLAACIRADPGLDEISRIWRSTAPVDDSYDTRCNDARIAVAQPLATILQRGLSREEVIRLLGEPDLPSHTDTERFGTDNLNYSLGFCHGDNASSVGDHASFVVTFRDGRSREARVTWS